MRRKGGPGPGARLEAMFKPRIHWGAEFLADEVRIQGLRREGAGTVAVASFAGSYAEAEAFARSHRLAQAGLHAAVSHLPFKIGASGNSGETEEAAAASLSPVGLAQDVWEAHGFEQADGRFVFATRSDLLRSFRETLGADLAGLWDLTASPLALLPFLDLASAPDRLAALLPETDHTHVLFFRRGVLEAYGKVFAGLRDAAQGTAYAHEMGKILIHHYLVRHPGAKLDALQLWRDGPQGEIGAALRPLGIAQVTTAWAASLPSPATVAGAAALAGPLQAGPPVSLVADPPALPVSRRLWMRQTGRLARMGSQGAAALALLVLASGLALAALKAVVDGKTRSWSGDLEKWETFQQRKAELRTRAAGWQGLLSQRTQSYASLQRIAALLPPELWLGSWETAATPGGFIHRLEGYSLTEARVGEFLASLEKAGGLAVKLKSTEKMRGETVAQKTGIAANRRGLIRFQLEISE
jgi:Tfp pilus assembly protein PilN